MRKRWIYVLLGLLALLTIIYLLRYHSGRSLTHKVPSNARQIVHINLRNLEKDIVLDILSHPIKYLRKKKGKRVDIDRKWKSFSKGIPIPKNLLFYTLGAEQGWISNKLEMNDGDGLFKLLIKEGFVESMQANYRIFTLAELSFVFSKTELIIVLGSSSAPLDLSTLFEDKDYLLMDDGMIAKLSNSEADLSYIDLQGSFLEADFIKGALTISGTLGTEFDYLTTSDHQLNQDPIFTLATRLNTNEQGKLFTKEFKTKFKETIHLSLDSIINGTDGNLKMQLNSVEKTNETIITYDYDDDFNKIEITSEQEVTIPNMEITLGLSDDLTLINYFKKKKAIQEIDGEAVFTPIPVYKFIAMDGPINLQLMSGKMDGSSYTKKAKWLMHLKVKQYLKEPLAIPLSKNLNSFLSMIDQIYSEIDPANNFQAKIEMVNPYRNFLGQLIRP